VTALALTGPLVLGAVFGYWLGRSGLGVTAALGIGGVLTLVGLGIWYADAPTSPVDCLDCSGYWGRWMDETMFTRWLPLTIVLWSVGVAMGVSKRRSDHRNRFSM
jgi:hypothetical protein